MTMNSNASLSKAGAVLLRVHHVVIMVFIIIIFFTVNINLSVYPTVYLIKCLQSQL